MTPVGPHTPDRRGRVIAPLIRDLDHEADRQARLCGLDPDDAQLDAEREHDEHVDRLNDMAGPEHMRWAA